MKCRIQYVWHCLSSLLVLVLVSLPFVAFAEPPPVPYQAGGGQHLTIGGMSIPRDVVFRFLPVTLPLAHIKVTSLFGIRPNPFGGYGEEMHPGVDFSAPIGTPVYSTAAGIVTMTETRGAYGLMVEVRHGLGFRTRYSHLCLATVIPGQVVDRNTIIGLVGNTGRSTGPHLYLEIWRGMERIDPVAFILKAYQLYHHLD